MPFIHPAIFWTGLAAVAVPILIHLLNRRRFRLRDWAAMQFIRQALRRHRRRLQIEQLILLALRCLMLAVLVMAIARPLVSSDSQISWFVLLPVMLIAAVVLAAATVLARDPTRRWILYAAGAGLVALVVLATVAEKAFQLERLRTRNSQDVVIVIDGSTSMTLEHEGKTNFQRAIEESRALVESLHASVVSMETKSDDAATKLLKIEETIEGHATNLRTLERELDDLKFSIEFLTSMRSESGRLLSWSE